MAKKRFALKYKPSVINAIVLFLVIILLVYVCIQVLGGAEGKSLSTQRTQSVTDNEFIYLNGYIFKDEAVLSGDENTVINYIAGDGEKIGVEQHVADIYSPVGMSAGELSDLQENLNSLNERIRLLEKHSSGSGAIADLAHISDDLLQSYYAYTNAIGNRDVQGTSLHSDKLFDAIVGHRALTGKGGVAENIHSRLEAERDALLESLACSPKSFISQESYHFFYSADGYEDIFTVSRLEDMSFAVLQKIIDEKPSESHANAIGKIMRTPKWYLCVPVGLSDCRKLEAGQRYDVIFTKNGDASIKMTLERINVEEDGAYMLFSSNDISLASHFSRVQSIKILTSSKSGYRIPTEALKTVEGEHGVFILVGNMVEFRRVTVIGGGNGYYIALTKEQDAEAEYTNEIPYLAINDLIITSGNDLYDGKHLN